MDYPIKRNDGQISVRLPKDQRHDTIRIIAESNNMIAQALKNIGESNVLLSKALNTPPSVNITGCTVINNEQFDTGISVKTENDQYETYTDQMEMELDGDEDNEENPS